MRRLDGKGAALDHGQSLNFTFDGTPLTGLKGDTLASALLANNVRVVGRSFKYHRPRGIWGAWVDEPNAIMSVTLNGTELPNCLATTTYLEDRMEARAVNAWPSARRDIKGALDLFSRFLGAGFYYKTFIWPDWHLFEPAIRKMAGLGAVSPDHLDSYTSDQRHDDCDTLVIGGGPAGLVAARTAAEAGQSVVLADDQALLGGTAYQCSEIDDQSPTDWVAEQRAAIEAAGGKILTQTTAYGIYDHNLVALVEQGPFATAPRLWRMRTRRTILATGAIDRPITFAGNDKPGVMSLFGAGEYLARYGLLPDTAVALANSTLAETALAALETEGTRITRLDPTTPGLHLTRLAGHQRHLCQRPPPPRRHRPRLGRAHPPCAPLAARRRQAHLGRAAPGLPPRRPTGNDASRRRGKRHLRHRRHSHRSPRRRAGRTPRPRRKPPRRHPPLAHTRHQGPSVD